MQCSGWTSGRTIGSNTLAHPSRLQHSGNMGTLSPSRNKRRAYCPRFASALLLAGSAIGAPSYAQPRVIDVSPVPSCGTCTIALQKSATIGDSLDPVLLDWATNVRRDQRGRYFATGYPGEQLLVFDSAGRFTRSLGRRGQGPGEFTSANRVRVGPDGSVHVFETNRRVTVYDPELRLRRTTTLPVAATIALPLAGGRMVVSSASPAVAPRRRGAAAPLIPQAAGPVRIINTDGTTIRLLGRAVGDTALRCPRCTSREVSNSTDAGAVWVGHYNRYQIEKWDTSGRHVLTLRRRADWFIPWGVDSTRPISSQEPQLAAIEEDSQGRIWLFFAVPDPTRRVDGRLGGRGGMAALVARVQGTLDTIVEVIDPVRGRLIATRRFADPLISAGGLYAYSVREVPSGYVFMEVWRLHIDSL